MKRFVIAALFFATLLALWELLVRQGVWSPYIVPEPLEVGRYLAGAVKDGTLLDASVVTLKRLVFGYVFSLVAGVPLGLLNARFQALRDTLGLLGLGLQTLPSVCWAPLALLWFGQTETAMFFIVIMGSLWSIMLATSEGVRNVPPHLRARGAHNGLEGVAHLDHRHPASLAAFHRQRHEAGLGVCVALADGRRNLHHDPDRVRTGSPPSLRPGTAGHGHRDRHHARDHWNRTARRQDHVLAIRAISSPPLGYRAQLMGGAV